MPALENDFSWSKSRAEEFEECRRKYFYARYLSWGGWERNAPKDVRLAYVLKNLKNRWAWKGETVHHVVETVLKALRSGKPMSEADALELLTRTMRADFLSSKAKKYLKEPKKSVGLFEHEYAKPVADPVWKTLHDEAAACIRNFMRSPLYKELEAEDKSGWLVIEDLEEFDFEGAKVYVKLDFARRRGDLVEILDWKTGKEEKEASVQIGVYAVYAMRRWNVPLEKVRAYLVFLTNPVPSLQEQALSQAVIEEAKKTISASVARMQALLADVAKNAPKPREAFAFTENTRLCSYCNFYAMCEKYTVPSSA